jgi:hypothetical protein
LHKKDSFGCAIRLLIEHFLLFAHFLCIQPAAGAKAFAGLAGEAEPFQQVNTSFHDLARSLNTVLQLVGRRLRSGEWCNAGDPQAEGET